MAKVLLEQIMNPAEEFSPIPFWFFNDAPDKEKIKKQLQDYVEKGVNGFVLHPRIGVPKDLPYLSEEYFEVMRYIVETAASLNMKVVLYDEGMYPSGSAHGMVVAANPEYASQGIILRDEPGNGKVLTRLADGRYLVKDFTGGTIRGIHFGEDDGEEGAPASADIMNADAVKLFINLTHDAYYEHLKEYFGTTIIAFFTDEPSALGRNAGRFREWVDGMDKEIKEAGGCLEELVGLFEKKKNKTTVIYHKLIKKHLREIFYAALSNWCADHGIALMGHPEVSDDVEEQLYFQMPGQDLIMRRVVPKTGGLLEFDSVQAKLAADIARHLGCRRNVNECFGVCYRDRIPWYFTAEDMKWYIDWLGIRGVNLYIPHAFYYSVEGARSGERPPDVGPNNIWWAHYRRFSDYMKRLSYLMTDSVNWAKVAVLCDNNNVPYTEIASLYENQIAFNYLPAGLLEQCEIKDDKICIRGYEYEVVLDCLGASNGQSEGILDETGLKKLQAVKLVYSAEELFALGADGYKAVETEETCKSLRAARIQKDGVDMILLSNEGECAITTTLNLKNVDKCHTLLVDLWKGSCVLAQDDPEITLQPCETVLVVAGKEDVDAKEKTPEICLGDWTDKFVLKEKADNKAVYEYVYQAQGTETSAYFTVTGEDMAECYCNGEFADVSFWNEHRLYIGDKLKKGENIIRLEMTGNAANIFEKANIEFGLMQK